MKLLEMNIIKDEMVSPETYSENWKKMITIIVENIEQDKDIVYDCLATFIAKVYVNYHFSEIMSTHNFDVNDYYRYASEKPQAFLLDIAYQVPIITNHDIEGILKASKNKVIGLLKFFHHDFVIPDKNYVIKEFINDRFSVVGADTIKEMLNGSKTDVYAVVYNSIVFGSKEIFTAVDGE